MPFSRGCPCKQFKIKRIAFFRRSQRGKSFRPDAILEYCKYQESRNASSASLRNIRRAVAHDFPYSRRRQLRFQHQLSSKMELRSPASKTEVAAESEGVAGLDGFKVLDSVAEELLLGKLFNEDDLGGHEDRRLAGLIGHGDFDERLRVVLSAAFEAQAALGHVLAKDYVITLLGMANASGVCDFDARMLAPLSPGAGRFLRSRQSQDGAALLLARIGTSRVRGRTSGWRVRQRRRCGRRGERKRRGAGLRRGRSRRKCRGQCVRRRK